MNLIELTAVGGAGEVLNYKVALNREFITAVAEIDSKLYMPAGCNAAVTLRGVDEPIPVTENYDTIVAQLRR